MMKLIKSDQQARMSTETIDVRMFIMSHGPSIGSAEYEALMTRTSKAFWASKARAPNRMTGARASHKSRKHRNRHKKLSAK